MGGHQTFETKTAYHAPQMYTIAQIKRTRIDEVTAVITFVAQFVTHRTQNRYYNFVYMSPCVYLYLIPFLFVDMTKYTNQMANIANITSEMFEMFSFCLLFSSYFFFFDVLFVLTSIHTNSCCVIHLPLFVRLSMQMLRWFQSCNRNAFDREFQQFYQLKNIMQIEIVKNA